MARLTLLDVHRRRSRPCRDRDPVPVRDDRHCWQQGASEHYRELVTRIREMGGKCCLRILNRSCSPSPGVAGAEPIT